MQLAYDFTVPVPPSEAWTVLLDLERVVPCLPGATLTSFDGESFVGTVRVKLGPVNLNYQGKGRFAVRDEDAGRVVIEASGREARGGGTAGTTATMTLRSGADEGSTVVTVQAELSVTGRPAQFGRGMIADVGGKLVGQFADCLAQRLAEAGTATETADADSGGAGSATPAAAEPLAQPAPSVAVPPNGSASTSAAPAAGSASTSAPVAGPPIDLLQVSAGPVVRRILPYAITFLAGVFVAWLLGRRG
ncbi:MAG TPA: SRPBCC family protein [Micromonosporaceae bacterium]